MSSETQPMKGRGSKHSNYERLENQEMDPLGLGVQSNQDPPKSDSKQSKSIGDYLGDHAETYILRASVLLTAASIALIILVFVGRARHWTRDSEIIKIVRALERVISASSLKMATAVIMVVGKRYVFFKLFANRGIHSQRMKLYSDPSIFSLVGCIFKFRFEILWLGLLWYWVLGWATGLTVRDVVQFSPVPIVGEMYIPSGSLDAQNNTTPPSLFQQTPLYFLEALTEDAGPSVNVSGAQTRSGEPTGRIIYPAMPQKSLSLPIDFAFNGTTPEAVLNGFQIAVQNVSSEPDKQPYCTVSGYLWSTDIWFSADTQSLSIIVGPGSPTILAGGLINNKTYTEYNATAVTMGGTLSRSSTDPYMQFALDGTYSPLTMSDTQWATVMVDVICNASLTYGNNVVNFGIWVNSNVPSDTYNLNVTKDQIWTSVLGGIIGSYTVANQNLSLSSSWTWPLVLVEGRNLDVEVFHLFYGAYVLIANIVISIIMLSVAWWCGCKVHPTFLDSTHILLDTSKNGHAVRLVNQSVETSVKAHGNPRLKAIQNEDFVEVTQIS